MPTRQRPAKRTGSPEHEAFVALLRLSTSLNQDVAELLKGYGLSAPQFNVLRILRGAGDAGLTCGDVAARLITKDSDITRLLDRLEREGLVERARAADDRRIIITHLTARGKTVLADLDAPIAALHRSQLGHLGTRKLQALVRLLAEASTNEFTGDHRT